MPIAPSRKFGASETAKLTERSAGGRSVTLTVMNIHGIWPGIFSGAGPFLVPVRVHVAEDAGGGFGVGRVDVRAQPKGPHGCLPAQR